MKLVLIGIQGAGKSTQGNFLSHRLKLPYLSTGHIFRQIAKEKTQLGRYVKELINSGSLIPDDKVIHIVNSYLSRPAYSRGYILDGFPRTLTQAKLFKNNVDKVIHIHISDKEALWRLAYRNDIRDDDTIEAIRKRIELFKKFTLPVLDYYKKQKRLAIIDGEQSIEEVREEILKSLGKQLIKNRVHQWTQKKNTIMAIVGLPGAGKTEAAEYYHSLGLPIISFSEIVNKAIDKKKMPHTLSVHHAVRQELRAKHGFEAMALLSRKKIESTLKKYNLIVIEGMRSWEEYQYLKKEFRDIRIFIVAIHADKDKRYERITLRKSRSSLKGEERDIDELLSTHMGPTIAFADYMVKNNFSKEEFYNKLDEVHREIYFS
jgi:adenylate kinase